MMYAPEIEKEIQTLTKAIEFEDGYEREMPSRWLAIQLLEGECIEPIPVEVQRALAEGTARLLDRFGRDLDLIFADNRYQFVRDLVGETLTRRDLEKPTRSDRIDRLLTNQYLGAPIFLVIMYFIFNIVQNVSAPFLDWIDYLFTGPVTRWVTALFTWVSAPGWLLSLTMDGVLAGLGAAGEPPTVLLAR